MSKPTITFRLSHYQLARGLQIVRALEPNFKLTSLNQLVKIIYTDYLAKMSLNQSDIVDPTILMEIQDFIINPRKRELDLMTLANEESITNIATISNFVPAQHNEEGSTISSVTDFSPPTDWIDQEI